MPPRLLGALHLSAFAVACRTCWLLGVAVLAWGCSALPFPFAYGMGQNEAGALLAAQQEPQL